jgi:ferredoxin--NADP+ reductase
LAKTPDRATEMKINLLQEYSRRKPTGKSRRLHIRFLVSPTELYGDSAGNVSRMQLVHNELFTTEAGSIQSRPKDAFEEIPVGLVFRSIGYKGVPLPEIPFNESWGVILNEKGRVIDPASKQPLPGLYTAGWIKRGPTGVIGTNKPDALETVEGMLRDLKDHKVPDPAYPDPTDAEALVRSRQPDFLTYDDWRTLDQLEIERGRLAGRPRVKFTQLSEMLVALGRQPAAVKPWGQITTQPLRPPQSFGVNSAKQSPVAIRRKSAAFASSLLAKTARAGVSARPAGLWQSPVAHCLCEPLNPSG